MDNIHRKRLGTNEAWNLLFEEYSILQRIQETGRFTISASQINKYREARLMAKFDHKSDLPEIFQNNHLAILPISRGDYVIAPFDAYSTLESVNQKVQHYSLPENLQSLDANNIPSETIAINCALASGILSDFLQEEVLHPTVSGRMSSGKFKFAISNKTTGDKMGISVDQAQIEIDSALEGNRSLALIEAKRDILFDDFLVRQLYYPFRTWKDNQRVTKPVRPIFLVYSNGIFTLYEYRFQYPCVYNSLVLLNKQRYTIEDITINTDDLQKCLDGIQFVIEPRIPFPQADRFDRIVNLCELLSVKEMKQGEITEEYAFDARQTSYYTDAAIYLDLVEKSKDKHGRAIYNLSNTGKRIMKMKHKEKQLAFCQQILQHRVFAQVFHENSIHGEMPIKSRIVQIMRNAGLYNIESLNTFERRSSTISGWVNWINGLVNDY